MVAVAAMNANEALAAPTQAESSAAQGELASLLSPNWYRVAALRPALRAHVRLHRHRYRGQVWHVVEDRIGHRYHRFDAATCRVIRQFDGQRDLGTLWSQLTQRVDPDTPTQEDLIQLVGQLHAADLVQCDVTPDLAELFERGRKERRRRFISRYANPLSIRVRLFDPDPALGAVLRACPSWFGPRVLALLAASIVVLAVVLGAFHWRELTENLAEQWLAADNLWVAAVVFPLLKAIHELAHGLAVKWRGGVVHDMGVMLLVLYPVPYVDASDASTFPRKGDRILVSLAGMAAEIVVASIALCLWVLLEPGLARAVAWNTVVLGSVTTVLFNANPLLRYDGYFALADAIEMPNLAQRANRAWGRIAGRWLFGWEAPQEAPVPAAERAWLIGYAPLAFAYRLSVTIGIALYVAGQYFFFGVLLGIGALIGGLVLPLVRSLRAMVRSPGYQRGRARVHAALAMTLAAVLAVLFVMPWPHHTAGDGVLWLPEDAIVRARTDGVVALDGDPLEPRRTVRAGERLAVTVHPELATKLREQRARLEEVRARWDAQRGVNPARAAQIEEEVRRELANLARLEDEQALQSVHATVDGRWVVDRPADLPGRFVRKGEVLGHTIGEHRPVVRVVVDPAIVDRVRAGVRATEVRFAAWPGRSFPAGDLREVPGAARQLPSPALGQGAGGAIPIDPRAERGDESLESLFQFDLALQETPPVTLLGARAWVRFEHPPEPIGWRGLAALRRVFLRHFLV